MVQPPKYYKVMILPLTAAAAAGAAEVIE